MIGGAAVLAPVHLLSNRGAEIGTNGPDDWNASAHTEWATAEKRQGSRSLRRLMHIA